MKEATRKTRKTAAAATETAAATAKPRTKAELLSDLAIAAHNAITPPAWSAWLATKQPNKETKADIAFLLELMHNPAFRPNGRGMANTLARYRPGYEDCVAASGKKSKCNGDTLAHLLSGLEPEQVATVAEQVLNLEPGFLHAKYERLNPGQMRMNSGNRIRAAAKRGDLTTDTVAAAIAAL